jgi:hypothetical protein
VQRFEKTISEALRMGLSRWAKGSGEQTRSQSEIFVVEIMTTTSRDRDVAKAISPSRGHHLIRNRRTWILGPNFTN